MMSSGRVVDPICQGQCGGRCNIGLRAGAAKRAGAVTRRGAGLAARDGVLATGDGAGGAQQVVGDHRAGQPGAVGGEQPGRKVSSGPSIKSAKVVSTMAWRRWVRSASAVGSSELVKNG